MSEVFEYGFDGGKGTATTRVHITRHDSDMTTTCDKMQVNDLAGRELLRQDGREKDQ